jgi:hypothetical protein
MIVVSTKQHGKNHSSGMQDRRVVFAAGFENFHGNVRFRIASGGVRETIKADGIFGRKGI